MSQECHSDARGLPFRPDIGYGVWHLCRLMGLGGMTTFGGASGNFPNAGIGGFSARTGDTAFPGRSDAGHEASRKVSPPGGSQLEHLSGL